MSIETQDDGSVKKEKINEDIDVIEMLSFSDEYYIFHAQSVIDLLEYKWNTYGFNFHSISFVSTFSQLILIIYYTYNIYLKDGLFEYVETDDPDILFGLERIPRSGNQDNLRNIPAFLLFVGLIYPVIYTFILISKIGPMKLIVEPHNVDKRVYVYVSYLGMTLFTILYHGRYDPQDFTSKLLMLIVIS